MDESALATALTQRTRVVSNTLCADFLTVEQASAARDHMAITLYKLLVEYLISEINRRSSRESEAATFIGCLDQAGFEHDPADSNGYKNRFWQFANNFTDEYLLFWSKQYLYASTETWRRPEALNFTTWVKEESHSVLLSNLSLYTDHYKGLIQEIDAISLQLGSAPAGMNDTLAFVDKLNQTHRVQKRAAGKDDGPSERFVPGHTKTSFGIRHYGGVSIREHNTHYVKVFYDTSDFLDSNRRGGQGDKSQALNADLARLVHGTADFHGSTNGLLHKILGDSASLVLKHKNTVSFTSGRITTPIRRKFAPGMDPLEYYLEDFDIADADKQPSSSDKQAISSNGAAGNRVGDAAGHRSTVITELYGELGALVKTFDSWKKWNVFCFKTCEELITGKFVDDKVREQLKRLDISLLVLLQTGQWSHQITWEDFYRRYGLLLDGDRKSTPLRDRCEEIIQMYGVVFRGGNGKMEAAENFVLLDEKAWWSLERNLFVRTWQSGSLLTLSKKSSPFSDKWEFSSTTSLDSNLANDDMVEQIKREAILNRQRKRADPLKGISHSRRLWLLITYLFTFWIPGFLLRLGGMRRSEVILAWREKIALCGLILIVSCCMIFVIAFMTRFLCPEQHMYTTDEVRNQLAGSGMVIINGQIFDVSEYAHPERKLNQDYGSDVSRYFPLRSANGALPAICNPIGNSPAFPTTCKDLRKCHDANAFYANIRFKKSKVGCCFVCS